MYTNLLLFLVAIFLFSVDTVPDTPLLPGWQSLLFFALIIVGYGRFACKLYNSPAAMRSGGYFKTEKQLSVLALVLYAVTLFCCDPKYYLTLISLGKTMPALVNIAGLLLFVVFLAVMWWAGKSNYEKVFGRSYTTGSFILSNIKANLPIVLPWVILSLLYDLVALLPFSGVKGLASSGWGDLVFYAVFLVFVLLFFPPMVRRLWGCKPLPDGYLKRHLDAFCKTQNFNADFYIWPLFEGRVLTAGVMGIVPGLRYILITPALIETMSLQELEAVMAHEIGHVKKKHLLLYVFLIGGFSLFAGLLAEPLIYFFLGQTWLNGIIIASSIDVEDVVTIVGAVPLLVFLIIYFRFIFGYFIRNFERQADLFSFKAIGDAGPLISAFDKISLLSGNIRNEKNWHHFGIGERIDCLEHAEQDGKLVDRHDRKVRLSLIAYALILLLTVFMVQQLPTETLAERYRENMAETILLQKARQEPDHALWQRLIGDLMINKKMEEQALVAYEKAFSLEPVNPEIMNNLAWLLLTSKNLELRDPFRALTLARAAATLQPKGYILDTLATAYWANSLVEEAVSTAEKAIAADISHKRYYLSQISKFRSISYDETVQELRKEMSQESP